MLYYIYYSVTCKIAILLCTILYSSVSDYSIANKPVVKEAQCTNRLFKANMYTFLFIPVN